MRAEKKIWESEVQRANSLSPVIRPEPKARVQRGSKRSGESREKSYIKCEAQSINRI